MKRKTLWRSPMWAFLSAFFCAVSGFFPSVSFAVTSAELKAIWTEPGDTTLSPDELQKLIDLALEDPETQALVEEVTLRIGAIAPSELIRIIKLCPPENITNENGLFSPVTDYYFSGLELPDREVKWDPSILEKAKNGLASRKYRTDTVEQIEIERMPEICFRSGLPLLESFATFVHELTHFLGHRNYSNLSLFDAEIILREYRDENDYAEKEIERAGGEMDAFTAQTKAVTRLKNRSGYAGPTYMTELFFDSRGNLKDRAGLKRYLLDDLRYRDRLRMEFRHNVEKSANQILSDLDWYGKVRQTTENNLRITRANIERMQGNLSRIPRGRANPSDAQKVMEILRDQERNEAYLNDYLLKVSREMERKRQLLEELKARFSSILRFRAG